MIVVSDSSTIISLAAVDQLQLLPSLYGSVVIAAVTQLEARLDPGEAAAVELTIESKADLLLIDDRHGREVALQHGLRIIVVLGVLLEGKRRGFLNDIAPVLDALHQRAVFGFLKNCVCEFSAKQEKTTDPNKLLNCSEHPLLFRALMRIPALALRTGGSATRRS